MKNTTIQQVTIAAFVLGALALVGMKPEATQMVNDSGSLSEPVRTWTIKAGSVHDGDTFRAISLTGEEIRVRLACVDAPELKQAGGIESRDFLRKMLPDDQEVILSIAETDRFGRSVAEVFVPTDNPEIEVAVNGEMVLAGHAHFYERYKSACPDNAEQMAHLESLAQDGKLGVWASGNPEKPWDFRRRNK